MSKGTKVKNSSSVHPEAAGKVECEPEMGEQASECLSREETEHGPMDPSPQLPVVHHALYLVVGLMSGLIEESAKQIIQNKK